MSSFYSKKPTQDSQLREFNVGEPEVANPFANLGPFERRELSPEERQLLHNMRQTEVEKESTISTQAKQRIEILANIGRLTKTIVIDNISFELKTLKAKETEDAHLTIFKCKTDAEAAYELRRQKLARALYLIDGKEVELTLGGKDFNLKLQLIDLMEEVTVNRLYKGLEELEKEVSDKYLPKNETEIKGVLEDIKKS